MGTALTLGGSCGLSWLESDAEDEARAAYAVTMRAHQTKYHVSEEDMDTLVELVGQPIECVTLLLSRSTPRVVQKMGLLWADRCGWVWLQV